MTLVNQNISHYKLVSQIENLRVAITRDHVVLGKVYNGMDLYDDAIRLSENSLQTDPSNQHMLWIGGYAYAKSGRRREAEEVIRKFGDIEKTQYVVHTFVASIYGALG